MTESVKKILDLARVLNSDAFSLTRCLILSLIAYATDGVQYRELKAALDISDGKLASNLKKLLEMGYVKKEEVQFENRKLDVYYLSEAGQREVQNLLRWMNTLREVMPNQC